MQEAPWKPAGLALRITLPRDEGSFTRPTRQATKCRRSSPLARSSAGRKRSLPHGRAPLQHLSPRRREGSRAAFAAEVLSRRESDPLLSAWATAPAPATEFDGGQHVGLAPAPTHVPSLTTPLTETDGGAVRYDLLRNRPSRIPRAASAAARLKPLDPTLASSAPAAAQAMQAAALGAKPSRLPEPAAAAKPEPVARLEGRQL